MNNRYFPSSSSSDEYFPSYNYSFDYTSPSSATYYASSFVPTTCPYHSPQMYYSNPSIPSMNISPMSFTYQQTPPSTIQVYSPPTQTRPIDRTPLRRHQCFKKNEIQTLHQVYLRDSHPTSDVLRQLAEQLNVTIDKVRQWFKNRRHSDKQKRRETQSSTSA
ncbi:unnamed protein product [Adineta ricciae]|uniref:Homeobox domain-containing protein n=1 Tax=Adineta ricciae TaxID=249248 RepID=A0A815B4K4_ADIRI|nr:unnamed protein product [Adineta ricciae]